MRCLARGNRRRDGAMIFMVAIVIVAFLLAAALAINVAWMHLVDTELRSATDSATRAGGEALARGRTIREARTEVIRVAGLNLVAGRPLIVAQDDITFGQARARDGQRYSFEPGQTPINAVRVTGQRTDGSGSGNVQFPFTPFLQRQTFQASRSATATIQERDICVVVDRSGSMKTQDAGRHPITGQLLTRLDALKLSVLTFRSVIDQTQGREKLSLVSYASTSTQEVPLDFSYGDFDTSMVEMEARGTTNIGAGIDDGVVLLSDGERARPVAAPVLVVMTDGRHNQARDPIRAARDAMDDLPRLTIHTVTFSPRADQNRMRRVADIGNGRHHHANNFDELQSVFEDIARTAGSVLIE